MTRFPSSNSMTCLGVFRGFLAGLLAGVLAAAFAGARPRDADLPFFGEAAFGIFNQTKKLKKRKKKMVFIRIF